MTIRQSLFAGACLAAAAFAALPAAAQTTPPNTARSNQNGQNGDVLSEVVVTAQRRVENVQNVPLAVTAFSPTQIAAAQIQATPDLVRFTPSVTGGLNTGTGSALTFFIRGLGSTEQIATFDVPVATYVDDIYFARQSANAVTLFDIDRVEVLRGPQGTLFGRNTTGGAVSIITRKPSKQFGFFVEGSYGSFDRAQIRGAIDVPITDKLLTKLSVFYVNDDGYARDVTTGEKLNGEEAKGVRFAVRAQPFSNARWDVSFDYIDQAKTTIGSFPYDPDYKVRSGLRYGGCTDNEIAKYFLTSRGNCARVQTGGITSNLTFDLPEWGALSFITGYRVTDQNFAIDFFNGVSPKGGYVIANQVRNDQFTQEVKLDGQRGRIKYVAGVFALTESNKTEEADAYGSLNLLLTDWVLHNKADSIAAYAQFDLALTDQLTLTAGGRSTHEKKKFGYDDAVKPASFYNGFFVGPFTGHLTSAAVAGAGIPLTQTTNKFTPRIALNYKIDPNKSVYVSATNGFKSGGWNTRVTSLSSVTIFGPEEAWSYELGARTEWFERRLRVNLTLYHEDVSDLQLLSGAPGPGGTIAFVTRNAGDLNATGLEYEINAIPVRNLEVFASGSFADKKYENIPAGRVGAGGVPCSSTPEPASCTTTRDEPVRFPDAQLTVGGSYKIPLATFGPTFASFGGELNLNGALSYSDYYWTSTYNDAPRTTGVPYGGTTPVSAPLSKTPPTYVLNIGAIYRSADRHWEAALECSNCTQEYYSTSSLLGLIYPNDPRRVTFRLKYAY